MGIPGFLSRMRRHGIDKVIGRTENQQLENTALAIIDGPSLAHFLFQSVKSVESAESAILVKCDYGKIGKAAITWLDTLQSSGFEIEGLYFDGSLPPHKKQTRTERLQSHADRLVSFKKISDEAAKSSRGSGSRMPSEWTLKRLSIARKELAPPPFLVSAVYEALSGSKYARGIAVVDGEADTFCAAAAHKASLEFPSRAVTIFTNDSDLIIYDSGPLTRVVMINQVEERDSDSGKVLQGFEFWPAELRNMVDPPLSHLVHVAFIMQSPNVSFEQALEYTGYPLDTDEFLEFANAYDTSRTNIGILKRCIREGTADCQFDSRVSELIHQVTVESSRQTDATDYRADIDFKDQRPSNLAPQQMDMYLPILLEDPARASAWTMGASLRTAAESVILYGHALDAPMFEYKRVGQSVTVAEITRPSIVLLDDHLTAWNQYMREEFLEEQHLTCINRWKFFVMQLVLSDMSHAEAALPDAEDVASVLNGDQSSTWRLVHLSAQFQAEYWSIRMLKQVLRHLEIRGMIGERGSMRPVKALNALNEQLQRFPKIAEFFGVNKQEVGVVRWQNITENYLRLLGS